VHKVHEVERAASNTKAAHYVREVGYDLKSAKHEIDKALGNGEKGNGGPNVFAKPVDMVSNLRHRANSDIGQGDPAGGVTGKAAPEIVPEVAQSEHAARKGAHFLHENLGKHLNTCANPKAHPLAVANATVHVMKTVKEWSTGEGLAKEFAQQALEHWAEKDKRVEKALEGGKLGHEGKEMAEHVSKVKEGIKNHDFVSVAQHSHEFVEKYHDIAQKLQPQHEVAQAAHSRHAGNAVGR
jgi:hypothetical protein